MDLVRDLLDKHVVDRNGRDMGRVDRVILDVRARTAPRVVGIELGLAALADRVHPILGRWAAAFEHALNVRDGRPLQIAFAQILDINNHVKVDVAAGETVAVAIERRLRRLDRLLGRRVLARNNRRIGRLEEFRAESRGTECVITDYVIGVAGLFERLGVGVRLVLGLRRGSGYVAHWDQIDISDPEHPRLTCSVEQLQKL
jgi:sporulation protein YlmC with PRC-barrel domain